MKISQRIHHRIWLKNLLSTVALLIVIGLLAWLSARYSVQSDWTANARNTLSEASQKILVTMPGEIVITVYLDQPALKKQLTDLVRRYQTGKSDLRLAIEDLEAHPEQLRRLDIAAAGAILVDYQGRSERLSTLSESSLTNLLRRLANANERWVTFLSGHGERSPTGDANHDLKTFARELERRNIKVQILNLAAMPFIPNNSALLVVAGPRTALLPGEAELIREYLQQGGNLLWLADPGVEQPGVLEETTGVRLLPGTIIDGGSKLYGVDDPSFVLVSEYPVHAITRNFQLITVFPQAAALAVDSESDFDAAAILSSIARSWTETGPIGKVVQFDADSDEHEGPLHLAFALERKLPGSRRQRIVVIGDGDFLANTYLGNAGNLDLGLRLFNWLTFDDQFIDIPAKTASDRKLQLTENSVMVMGFGFLVILPLLLIATGIFIWRRRKSL